MLASLEPKVILIKLLVMMTALPFRECVKAWVASLLGDRTAKNQGRITLNPAKQLDLFGSIAMLLVGFGWGKPVLVNPRNFKNPKAGMAIFSLAGSVSNLLLAYVLLIIYRTLEFFSANNSFNAPITIEILGTMVLLNIGLAVFNLLPIPPLDGSRIAMLFLSPKKYFQIMQYERYIFIGLIAVLWLGILDKPLSFLVISMSKVLWFLTDFLEPIFRMVV